MRLISDVKGALTNFQVLLQHLFMRVLTLDWLTPSTLAAWRKFKCSATAKAWINDAKGMREPRGERIPFPHGGLVSLTG
nr:hypothetical protein [Chelativorans xinjiangense]